MLRIGFATEYYTLWDVHDEPQYFTDSYGKHWLQRIKTHFNYMQNISKDLSVVKAKYPDVKIDEDLKGQTRSFIKSTEDDLSPEILKFGKYCGKPIAEVAETDFDYVLWLVANARLETRNVCMALSKVQEFIAERERQRQEKENSHPAAQSGEVEITFLMNPNKHVTENCLFENIPAEERTDSLLAYTDKQYAEATIGEGNIIAVIFDEVKAVGVGSMYPYNMGIINGKAMKLKGKTMKLNLEIISTARSEYGVLQIAIIK